MDLANANSGYLLALNYWVGLETCLDQLFVFRQVLEICPSTFSVLLNILEMCRDRTPENIVYCVLCIGYWMLAIAITYFAQLAQGSLSFPDRTTVQVLMLQLNKDVSRNLQLTKEPTLRACLTWSEVCALSFDVAEPNPQPVPNKLRYKTRTTNRYPKSVGRAQTQQLLGNSLQLEQMQNLHWKWQSENTHPENRAHRHNKNMYRKHRKNT